MNTRRESLSEQKKMNNDGDPLPSSVVIQNSNYASFKNSHDQKRCSSDSTTRVSKSSVKRVKFSENKKIETVAYYDRACREKITPLSSKNPYDLTIIQKLIAQKIKQSAIKTIRRKTRRPRVPLVQKRTAA